MNQTKVSYTVKFSGESGQGVNSAGEIFAGALKNSGFKTFGYREYPSLIEGGNACYQIDFSDQPVYWTSQKTDVLVAISRESIFEYLESLKPDGYILHSLANLYLNKSQQQFVDDNNIKIQYINAEQIAIQSGADKRIVNVLMMALLWHNLGLQDQPLLDQLNKRYGNKEKLLDLDIKIVEEVKGIELVDLKQSLNIEIPKNTVTDGYQMSGNIALALGAINAGMRAIYAYPMTPATSIFKYIADTAKETGIVAKQTEDEISAAQMTIGSMFMGTRAMTATSGGGLDLMSESLSFAGESEIPMIIVLAQRSGASTGQPTWSGAGDLNAAIYAGHGDFPRVVVSVSDAQSAFTIVQQSFNIAEEFQLPVIILTEKNIAESLYQVNKFDSNIEIKRGITQESTSNLFTPEDRYKITDSGVSPRWLPGTSEATYIGNSDEHSYNGDSTENAEIVATMNKKRFAKLDTVADILPEPQLYGNEESSNVLVGWGSTKSLIQEYLKFHNDIAYLHYEWISPFNSEILNKLIKDGKNISFIENNVTGQLMEYAIQKTPALTVHKKLLKYDGRPIYLEELSEFIKTL